ncbi:abscisic acid receptor PYL9 [Glycine max]|uniref:abscisic acid receptor PYL9 n=1 Tax=Glycine max TaxID=3847 RepID=UPI00071935EB|nr:abscisic acid receptor PYL9 [Glycine max]|eukprot:XP_014622331.1 abscisic acid receptor PYL9 [Glycine max]
MRRAGNDGELSSTEMECIRRHHRQEAADDNQCASSLVKHIRASLPLVVWSLVKRFDEPHKYKRVLYVGDHIYGDILSRKKVLHDSNGVDGLPIEGVEIASFDQLHCSRAKVDGNFSLGILIE